MWPEITIFRGMAKNLLQERDGNVTLMLHYTYIPLRIKLLCSLVINPLPPNDIYIYIYIYICRTAQLTSRRCILNIYSTNIRDEYFKLAA
jgi:hypothetical protein